jgi:hypothetical protein
MKEAIHQRLYIRPGLAVMGVDLSLQGGMLPREILALGDFSIQVLAHPPHRTLHKIFIFFGYFLTILLLRSNLPL